MKTLDQSLKQIADLQAEVDRLKEQKEVMRLEYKELELQLTEDENIERARDNALAERDALQTQLAAAQARERHTRETLHKFMQAASAPIPQQVAEPAPTEPNMFWNHDDAEKLYFSIDEFLNDEICNGTPLEVGDTRTIQCALRLPNIEIRITAVHGEECEADYEVIAAAPQPKDMK